MERARENGVTREGWIESRRLGTSVGLFLLLRTDGDLGVRFADLAGVGDRHARRFPTCKRTVILTAFRTTGSNGSGS